ncbi:hypothetical protein [Fusobacterium varium]|uniref:hypothetical protein n=1 Tax=Fusobacterium varium TaxID=856 RepID=UPI0030D04341
MNRKVFNLAILLGVLLFNGCSTLTSSEKEVKKEQTEKEGIASNINDISEEVLHRDYRIYNNAQWGNVNRLNIFSD